LPLEGLHTFWNSGFKRPLGRSRFFPPNQYSGLTLESISGPNVEEPPIAMRNLTAKKLREAIFWL
jgi:hypothetical protein